MNLPSARKLLLLLASTAWLPVVVTCDPGFDYAVVGVPWDVFVVDTYDPGYYDVWYYY